MCHFVKIGILEILKRGVLLLDSYSVIYMFVSFLKLQWHFNVCIWIIIGGLFGAAMSSW